MKFFKKSDMGGSALISFSCPQCSHLQRNNDVQWNQSKQGFTMQCTCDHCGFQPLRFGHQNTFFSIASVRTNLGMAGFYKHGERSQRDRNDDGRFGLSHRPTPLSQVFGLNNHEACRRDSVVSPAEDTGAEAQTTPYDHSTLSTASARAAEAPSVQGHAEIPSPSIASRRTAFRRRAIGVLKHLLPTHDRPRSRSIDLGERPVDTHRPAELSKWRQFFRSKKDGKEASSQTGSINTRAAHDLIEDTDGTGESDLEARRHERTVAAAQRDATSDMSNGRVPAYSLRAVDETSSLGCCSHFNGDLAHQVSGAGGVVGSSTNLYRNSVCISISTDATEPRSDTPLTLRLPSLPFAQGSNRNSGSSSTSYLSTNRGSSHSRGRASNIGSAVPTRSTSLEAYGPN